MRRAATAVWSLYPAEVTVGGKVYRACRVFVLDDLVSVWGAGPHGVQELVRFERSGDAVLAPAGAVGARARSTVEVLVDGRAVALHVNRAGGCGCGSPLKSMPVPDFGA